MGSLPGDTPASIITCTCTGDSTMNFFNVAAFAAFDTFAAFPGF